jgi:hypothetical protein
VLREPAIPAPGLVRTKKAAEAALALDAVHQRGLARAALKGIRNELAEELSKTEADEFHVDQFQREILVLEQVLRTWWE